MAARNPAYLKANRMSPQSLDALFRLGASKPGHRSIRWIVAEAPEQQEKTRCNPASPQADACPDRRQRRRPDLNHVCDQPNAPSRLGRVFRLALSSQGILTIRLESFRGRAALVTVHRSQKDAPMAWVGRRLICPSRGVPG